MKRKFIIIPVLALVAAACSKDYGQDDRREIVIVVEDGFSVSTDTKASATEVTSIPSTLYWGATTGNSGSEVDKYASTKGTVSSSKISTGKFQTLSPTSYNWYVSNMPMTVGAATTVAAKNTTDVICGRTAASSSTTPSVALEHVFARTGTVTSKAAKGTLSNVSYSIVGKGTVNGTEGTYDMTSGTWKAATTKLSSAVALTGSSDLYLIPGTYTVSITYTYTRGDYVHASVTKSADVTLQQGKVNNISITVPDEGSAIQIAVTLTDWASTTLNVTAS